MWVGLGGTRQAWLAGFLAFGVWCREHRFPGLGVPVPKPRPGLATRRNNRMSKTTKSQRGPRNNPAALPASTAPTSGNGAVASAKTTAGPATTTAARPVPQAPKANNAIVRLPATTEPDVNSESVLKAELMESLGIGSETKPVQPARAEPEDDLQDGALLDDEERDATETTEGATTEGDDDGAAADETPVSEGVAAEDEASGEVTAETTEDGGETESPEHSGGEETQAAADDAVEGADDEALEALARERKWPKSYLRRIKQLNAKARSELAAREEQITALRDEVEQLRKNPAAAAAVPTDVEQQLQADIAAAERVIDFVDDNPEGATTPDQRQWTREELRAEKRKADRLLREKEDELRRVRAQRSEANKRVDVLLPTRHPALKDRTSEQARAYDALLKQYPVLKSDPVLRLLVSDATAYAVTLQRQKAKAPVPTTNGTATNGRVVTPARPAAAVVQRAPGKPRATAPAVNGTRANVRAAETRFMESGDPAAGKELLARFLTDSE